MLLFLTPSQQSVIMYQSLSPLVFFGQDISIWMNYEICVFLHLLYITKYSLLQAYIGRDYIRWW